MCICKACYTLGMIFQASHYSDFQHSPFSKAKCECFLNRLTLLDFLPICDLVENSLYEFLVDHASPTHLSHVPSDTFCTFILRDRTLPLSKSKWGYSLHCLLSASNLEQGGSWSMSAALSQNHPAVTVWSGNLKYHLNKQPWFSFPSCQALCYALSIHYLTNPHTILWLPTIAIILSFFKMRKPSQLSRWWAPR